MGTPLQVERPFSSLSPYSLSDTHISASQQSPTATYPYDSINDQRIYASEHMSSHIPFPPYTNPPRVRTNTDTNTSKQGMMNASLGADDNMSGGSGTMKRTNKTHVPSACVNCKRAHLACDVSRPCKRCVALGKVDTCIDIKHKKRGRPKLKDKKPHPYNTHATADAKTWVQNPQFLPPTTTNPNQNPPNLHQQNDQSPSLPNSHSFSPASFISTSQHSSSRHHLHHHHHHRHNHFSTSYITKSPKFINQSISRQQTHSQQENTPIITMFLTIGSIACARVSDECLGIMGYYPSELVHKSLFDYVHVQDTEKLQKLVSSLLDNANRYYQNQSAHQYQFPSPISDPVTTDDPGFSQISPEELQCPALGGPIIEVSDSIHLKQRIGQYDLYNVRMYLGGGLYADLTRKDTWNKMYIVALFNRTKLGTCFSNNESNYVQPRMNGNSAVGGFSTQIISLPTSTIDPALLTMHNTSSSSSNLGVGRSGLLSPDLSPRQIPEIGSTSLYNEINHSSPTFNFSHRKPLHPYNSHDHFSHDHRNISETFTPIASRPNPVTPIVSRSESLISPPSSLQTCSSSGSQSPFSFERRSSAFNAVRSPSDGTLSLSIPFYNEIENKSLDPSSYTCQSNRFHNNNDNVTFNHSHHDHDELSSPPSNNSFPTFQNDEHDERVIEDIMVSTIPRKSSSHVSRVGDDSASTTRMSVNSLLCNN